MTKMMGKKEIKWVRDAHFIYWDEEGPFLEHPNKCPTLSRKLETITLELYECIPGIEEMEAGFSARNYAGKRKALPWETPEGVEGKFEIEWYYIAQWIVGKDEIDSEFGWREVYPRREPGPEVWDDTLGWG